jgi:hypothetical protein
MVTWRLLLERNAVFARWQKAIVVNLCQLRDARQAECPSDLRDIRCKAIPVMGADAVLERGRRDDLMAAEPRKSFGGLCVC